MQHRTVRWFWSNRRFGKDVAAASLIQISTSNLCKHFYFPHTCHMPIPSHHPWYYLIRGSDRDAPYRARLSTPFWSVLTLQMSLSYSYLLSYLLTHSIQQRLSWEANRFSASQEIPRILWRPNIHYRIHKYSPFFPILSQLDPFYTAHPTSWRPILTSSSHLRLGLPSYLFPHQDPVYASPLPHTRYIPHPSHSYRCHCR